MAEWQNGRMAVWQYGSIGNKAEWQYGSVAIWQCGTCGNMAEWTEYGKMEVWQNGSMAEQGMINIQNAYEPCQYYGAKLLLSY